ncbi:hypothetical protein P167DRAFT_534103 [Morchella conica CCBAS932]|uniref:Uncharacterized protein n=1 Tax=Morchella conica CCBAS932 TaxID=1392247 RepID=A0A3N4KUR0_9PEZI|nr:hypothetical protein P167DRAFT_534103 [Morchella conica CCBAS932]
MAVCLSVCLSVCMGVCYVGVGMQWWGNLIFIDYYFTHAAFFALLAHTLFLQRHVTSLSSAPIYLQVPA